MARDITQEQWDQQLEHRKKSKHPASFRLSVEALARLDQMSDVLGVSKADTLEKAINLMAADLVDGDSDQTVIRRCSHLLQRVTKENQSGG